MTVTPVGLVRRALRRTLRDALEAAAPPGESGTHIDPLTVPPPEPGAWGATHAAVMASPEMAAFRACLRMGADDIRTSVLRELASFYDVSEDEALKRCLHWEEISLREWHSVADPATDEGAATDGEDAAEPDPDQVRVAFYRTMQSWSYDLLWWAYVQAEGHADPASVIALRWLEQRVTGRRHLDFGAGVGVTSQLFVECGWSSTLADLSSTLLDFARYRFERRGLEAQFIDLGQETLPAGRYDAITAIDTLAHVPDVFTTARQLGEALVMGGYLIANVDVRETEDITVWHVQSNDLVARYDILRAGFRKVGVMGYGMVAYQRIDVSGFAEWRRVTWLWLTHVSPFRSAARAAARPFLRALARRRSRREVPGEG